MRFRRKLFHRFCLFVAVICRFRPQAHYGTGTHKWIEDNVIIDCRLQIQGQILSKVILDFVSARSERITRVKQEGH